MAGIKIDSMHFLRGTKKSFSEEKQCVATKDKEKLQFSQNPPAKVN
jgi:hypothetical protein